MTPTHLRIMSTDGCAGRCTSERAANLPTPVANSTSPRRASRTSRRFTILASVKGCRIEVRDVDSQGNCELIGYLDARAISPDHDDDDEGDEERESSREPTPQHDHELDGDDETSRVVILGRRDEVALAAASEGVTAAPRVRGRAASRERMTAPPNRTR